MEHCPFEQRIIESQKSGVRDEILILHTASCMQCRQTIQIISSLAMAQKESEKKVRTLPGGRYLYLKAQFTKREERLSKLDLIKMFGLSIMSVLGLFGLLLWKVPDILEWVRGFSASKILHLLEMFPYGIPAGIAVLFLFSIWIFSMDMFLEKK